VKKKLSLNYIIRYVTEDDLQYLGKYDVGIYSGLDKYSEILSMLSKVSENVVWITFCDAMQKDKINTNIDVCVFNLKREENESVMGI
jgi:peptide methionine sulfoxide reductase MsrB